VADPLKDLESKDLEAASESAGSRRAVRWAEIFVGLVLVPVVAVSGVGAIVLGWQMPSNGRFFASLSALLLLFVCIWCARMVWRAITGCPGAQTGLMSPTALGLAGVFFIVLPVVAALSTEWHLRGLSG